MNFWCIYNSPLMIGGNLPENRPLEEKLFSNAEVLAVDQQGENPKQLYKNDGSMVWVSRVLGSKDLYVGMFNIGEDAHEVAVDFKSLGLKGKVKVRDLWKHSDLGAYKSRYGQKLNPHASALVRLSVQ
jgi:alpha-galactosidase